MDHKFSTLKGIIGSLMAMAFPFLKVLNEAGQFLGMAGGLVLLYYSIKHKRKQLRNEERKSSDTDKTKMS